MPIYTIISFYLGITVEAVFLLANRFEKDDLKKVLICLLMSPAGFIPGKQEYSYDIRYHLFVVAMVFCFVYAVMFKKKILTVINKEIILAWNLIFLYVYFQQSFSSWQILTNLVLILSVLAIINAFGNFDKYYFWRAYFYIWFLLLIIGVTAMHFSFGQINSFFSSEKNDFTALAGIFFSGITFLYLAVNVWYIWELIPLPGKHENLKHRITEVKKDINTLVQDYQGEKINPWLTAAFAIVAAALLSLNFYLHFISDFLLIPILISAISVIDKQISNWQNNSAPVSAN